MAQKKRNNTLIWILLGVLVVAVVAVVLKRKAQPRGEKVTTEKVEARQIKEMVAASGKVFPVTEVKISSDVSGEIVELYVEEGDSVVMGQVLAKIDPDAYQSQVERGVASVNASKAQLANSRSQIENFKAQKEQIQAQLENANEIHTRNEQLKNEGVISEADFEASLSNLRALQANLRAADANIRASEQSAKAAEFQVASTEATLKEVRTSLRRTTIYAPVSGIVSLLNVEKGERVVGTIQMTGTEMMRIANLNAMEVQVEVSENDIPRVSIGDIAEIEVDAYIDRKFEGRVSQIANSASNTASGAVVALTTDQVTNFIVTIDISPESYKDLISKNKPYPFRPGMSASVEVNTNTLDGAISVPIQSVTTRELDEDDSDVKKTNVSKDDEEVVEVVFVVSADTVQMVEVQTGIQDDSYIQILSGIEEGQEVVTGPYSAVARKLKAGSEVRVVDEDELFKEN